jgi:colicin import membrane protein
MSQTTLRPYAWSVALHATVVLLLVAGATFTRPEFVEPLPIEAVMVDDSVIEALTREKRQSSQRERERRRKEEEARLEREREQAEAAEAEAVEQDRQESRRETELTARRQADLKRKAQAEAVVRRKAEAETAQRKSAADAAARKKAETEAATRRKAEVEARERAQREADLQARLAEEERRATALSSGMRGQYVALIQARVQRNWIRPATARPGLKCTVKVTQIPGGEVVGASMGACNGDETVKQSILSAVLRSSPLPAPPDPALFERNLVIEFVPED